MVTRWFSSARARVRTSSSESLSSVSAASRHRESSAPSPPPAPAYHSRFSLNKEMAAAALAGAPEQPGEVQPGSCRHPTVATGRCGSEGPVERGRRVLRASRSLLHAGQRPEVECRLPEEAERHRLLCGAGEGVDGVVEAMLRLRDAAEHRLGVHQAPRVPDGGQDAQRLGAVECRGRGVTQHQRPVGSEHEAGRRLPVQVQASVRRQAVGCSCQRVGGQALLEAHEGAVA